RRNPLWRARWPAAVSREDFYAWKSIASATVQWGESRIGVGGLQSGKPGFWRQLFEAISQFDPNLTRGAAAVEIGRDGIGGQEMGLVTDFLVRDVFAIDPHIHIGTADIG